VTVLFTRRPRRRSLNLSFDEIITELDAEFAREACVD
jgi:hypothetical protein